MAQGRRTDRPDGGTGSAVLFGQGGHPNLVSYTTRGTAINAGNPLNLAGAITADNLSTSDTKAVYGEFKWQATDPLTVTLNARYDDIDGKIRELHSA